MKRYTLEREISVRRPLQEVFGFFSRPENLARITPPWLGFRILTPSPIVMKPGTLIDYTVRVMGFRVHWQTLISEYEPPYRFVDVQLKGPYAFWRHTHSFTGIDRGTRIRDEVQYGLPLGALGTVARTVAVRRQLEAIFAYRAEVIAELFDAQTHPIL